MSSSLWPHGLQHAGLFCPSLSSGLCSDSCPSSWGCCLHRQKWRIPYYLDIYQFGHTSFIPDFQSLPCIVSIPLGASPLAFLLGLACWQRVLLVFLHLRMTWFCLYSWGYLLDIEFGVNGTLKTLFHFLLTPMVSGEKSAVFQLTVHPHEMSHIPRSHAPVTCPGLQHVFLFLCLQ